ncbi:MAG: hypothetical protein RML36_02450 [Anaerolineae bacterium]|nr:hypothetical protein [Anaerolineae bacterium]MDW8098328.1 hypothetical protein [Anaerolineae bacterium]
MMQPRLTFFCELEADALQRLFADPAVVNDLAALGASVSLGILDLSPERAAVVQRLNQAGISVIAWQLLPKSQGYWYNAGNAAQAAARYLAFRAWTAEHGLRWAGIGIDIELDIREVQQLLINKWHLLPTILRRAFDSERLRRAQAEYSALVQQMRADGYRVDSYLLPWVLDERKAGSTLLQRIGGLVDVPADREVPMLYSSFMRPRGPGMLWSYAQDVPSVGLGSTGGGVCLEGMPEIRPLDWNEFSRDLRLARRWTNDIHVFSLEGCVQQGFLARLKDFDWNQPITPPLEMAEQVERFRKALRAGLWASAHPFTVFGGLIGALWLVSRLRRTRG